MWEIYALAILMIVGSIVAVQTRYLLSAVISLAVVGLALCVAFLYLQAPDCAITQIVVEVIALVILIRATGIEKDLSEIKGRREVFALVSVIIFIVVFAAFTSVLLDFRAYDTLGEATVLFTSILGAIVVLREIGRKHR